MKVIKSMLVFLVVVVLPCTLLGQEHPDLSGPGVPPPDFERVASTGYQFLKIPSNARIAGMGGILTSISRGDASMAIVNPASIADVTNWGFSVTQNEWIADINYNSGAIVKNFGKLGVFGINFIYLDYGDMTRTENVPIFDDAGNYTFRVRQDFELGTFSAHDLSIGVTYARNVTDRLQFGANVKYIEEELDDASAGELAIDVGTVYYTGLKSLRVAMLGRNFGPDAEFVQFDERIAFPSAKVKLPMTFVLGAALDVMEGGENNPHLWTIAGEFVHTNDAEEKVNIGTEYSFMDFVMLRGGYRAFYDEEGITFGAGLRVHTESFSVLINYAYMDFGRLDSVNMFSFSFGFD